MLEAVDFVHAEGWDAEGPSLFALVPTALLAQELAQPDPEPDDAPFTLVLQEDLPTHIRAGSDELVDYVARALWPPQVAGAILAQEIIFKDVANPTPRPARLFSGVLRDGAELTLLQLRPTEEELAASPFAEDQVELRGGPGVAPGVIEALSHGLHQSWEEEL